MEGTKEFHVGFDGTTRTVRFGVFCGQCSRGLCGQSQTSDGNPPHWGRSVTVELCSECVKELEKVAYDQGFVAGSQAVRDDVDEQRSRP